MDPNPPSNPQFPQPNQEPNDIPPPNHPVNAYQQPVNQPTPVPQPSQTPSVKKNNRWIVWLVLWLGILPVMGILQFVVRFVLASSVDDPTSIDVISSLLNIVSALAGIYFFFGWIPMVISLSRRSKQTT